MPGHRPLHRADTTAKALIKAAKDLGFDYLPHDGSIDGTLWMPATGRLQLVDWKVKGRELTPAQQRLLTSGWQIRFLSDAVQLEHLAAEMKR